MTKSAGGKEVGRISIRVVPDTSKFRDRLKRDLEALEKVLKGEIGMAPDMDGFREKVKAATAGMDATVKVKADTDRLKQSMRGVIPDKGIRLRLDPQFDYQLRQRLHRIGAIKVPVIPDVKSFRQKLSGATQSIFSDKNRFGRLSRSIADVGKNALNSVANFRAFGMSMITLAALASLVVPTISLVSGALAALPGILAGAVAPIAAVALGLDGIKKAAENAGIPAAFKSLQATVSQVFAEGLTPVFTRLLDSMPALKNGLSAVAEGVVNMTDGFVNAITSSRGMAQIQGTLYNIGDALTRAAPGIEDFTAGMLTLVNSFSTKFAGMADAFNGFAERFLGWVERITAVDASGTSQFDRAMQGLAETLKGLGGIVGDLLTKGFDWLSNPSNIDSITVFFINLRSAVSGLWTVFSGLFDAVVRFHQGIVNVVNFLSGNWDSVTGPLKTVADTISSIGNAMSEARNQVSAAMTEIVSSVTGGGSQVVSEVGSWPSRIVGALGNLGGLLVAAGRALMDGLLNGIKAGFQAVTNFVGTIAGTIASLKGPLPYDRVVLTPNGEALMEGLGTGLQNGFQNVLAMAKEMAQRISQAMADGTDLSGMLGGNKFPDLSKALDTIEQERKALKVQLDNTADKGMKSQLRDQLKQLQVVKNQLNLQRDQLKNAQKYGGELANQVGVQENLGEKIYDAGVNLGKATTDQLMSDLNVGGGAISNLGNELVNWGLNAGKKFIFNVNSMDDALAGQRNLVNREALQFDRR